MDFSKLTALCVAGLLLGADQPARGQNILRFRAPEAEDAAVSADREVPGQSPLMTARFVSPVPAVRAVQPLPAEPQPAPTTDAPAHATPALGLPAAGPGAYAGPYLPGYNGPVGGGCQSWPYYDNPWANYADEKLAAHHRWQEHRCHSLLWWLDPKGGLFDIFGIFRRRRPACDQYCAAGIAENTSEPTPAAADPAFVPPTNALPRRGTLPRNEIPAGAGTARPAKSIAQQRRPADNRR